MEIDDCEYRLLNLSLNVFSGVSLFDELISSRQHQAFPSLQGVLRSQFPERPEHDPVAWTRMPEVKLRVKLAKALRNVNVQMLQLLCSCTPPLTVGRNDLTQ